MKKSINIACKILLSLVTALAIIFFAIYFIEFFKSGTYPYDYRIIILLASIVTILFSIGSLLKVWLEGDLKTKIILTVILVINIIISGIAIYYYLDAPKKFIKKVNLANLVFIINYIMTFIYIIIEELFEKMKSSDGKILKSINPASFGSLILMIVFMFLVISSDPKTYILNFVFLFITLLSLIIVLKHWGVKCNTLSLVLAVISSIIFFISGIVFAKYFDTIEKYTISTFVNAIAIILMIMACLANIDEKKTIPTLILQIIILIGGIVIFNTIRIDKTAKLGEMKDINIYRIISIFLIYLYIIKDQMENIISKNIISIAFSGVTLVMGIIFMILAINKIDELYYIFFKQIEIYAIIALVLLVIGSIYLIVDKKLLNKKTAIEN